MSELQAAYQGQEPEFDPCALPNVLTLGPMTLTGHITIYSASPIYIVGKQKPEHSFTIGPYRSIIDESPED